MEGFPNPNMMQHSRGMNPISGNPLEFMNLDKSIAVLSKMDDITWGRHANPWSVWTRFIILPVLALVIWSRVWLGWYSLIPIGLVLFWTWLNPRVFSKPKTTKRWSSKAVLGERVWLKRKELSVPQHHLKAILVLNVLTASGVPFLIWGLYTFLIWPTILGVLLVYAGKMWFLDRMVWLYEDMKNASPEYKSWLY